MTKSQVVMSSYKGKSKHQVLRMPIGHDDGNGDGSVGVMVLQEGQGESPRKYDLQERTALFGESVIRFAKKIPQSAVNDRLISQLVGASTSVGANYCEADDGVSRKDFRNKIGTCRKEAKEAKFFLRMVATAEPGLREECRALWQEAKELHLIFCAILRK